MPRAYRCWLTPLALSLAVALAALTAAAAGLLANRCATCDLRLTPTGTDRTLVVSTVALVLGAVVVTAVGGTLQLLAVRPARPAFLVRSAALQTALAALGPVVLLEGGLSTRLLLIGLLATTAFLPAMGLSGVALLRLPRYRRIRRRNYFS